MFWIPAIEVLNEFACGLKKFKVYYVNLRTFNICVLKFKFGLPGRMRERTL